MNIGLLRRLWHHSTVVIEDYHGRLIRLPDERWQHIISAPRQYMATMREFVAETLQAPNVIRKSNSDPDTVSLYYRWFDATVVGPKWACVVV